VSKNRLNILHGGTIASMVDLGGSLAVASRGLFATGVSTDLNVTYLSSGGKIGDLIKAEVSCDKCTLTPLPFTLTVSSILSCIDSFRSRTVLIRATSSW
jgi:hypothetical protein